MGVIIVLAYTESVLISYCSCFPSCLSTTMALMYTDYWLLQQEELFCVLSIKIFRKRYTSSLFFSVFCGKKIKMDFAPSV